MPSCAVGQAHRAVAGPRLHHVETRSRRSSSVVVRAAASEHRSDRRDVLTAGLLSPLLLAAGGSGRAAVAAEDGTALGQSIYSLSADMYEQPVSLEKYRGQVLLVMNVASEWPLQNVAYPGSKALYDKYREAGFNIIAFPCNQFGGQAPGSSQEEREWAWRKFGFEFDVFDKIEVNGPGTHPVYQVLKREQPRSVPGSSAPPPGEPGRIEWNYTKFLVDRDGVPRKRFKPGFDPLEFEGDIRLLLAGKDPLPEECILHPGRSVCKVDRLLGVE